MSERKRTHIQITIHARPIDIAGGSRRGHRRQTQEAGARSPLMDRHALVAPISRVTPLA